MEDIFVARVMCTDLHTLGPDALVEEAAETMLENHIGSVLVVDEDNELLGILTTTDFVRIVAENRPKDETTVAAAMTTDVITANVQDSIREAADTLIEHGIHHLPVTDDSAGVVGMLTTTDLASYLSSVESPSPL